MKQANFWAQFSDSFAHKNNYVIGQHNMYLFLERVAQEKNLGHTLELACGMGTYSEIIRKQSDSLVLSDLAVEMVDACKNRFTQTDNINFLVADCWQLPFADQQFDTLFMANLLHIIPNAYSVIDECKRVVKTAGKVIILDVTQQNMSFWQRIALKYRYQKTYKKPIHQGNYPFDKETMSHYLNDNGWLVKQSEFLGNSVKAIYIVAEKQETVS